MNLIYWLFALRAQQFWKEGRDSSGWISAGTGFHLSERDDVRVSLLPQRQAVRARCRSAQRPQDGPAGGVRGNPVIVSTGPLEPDHEGEM